MGEWNLWVEGRVNLAEAECAKGDDLTAAGRHADAADRYMAAADYFAEAGRAEEERFALLARSSALRAAVRAL